MAKNEVSCNWCFTVNNYSPEDEQSIQQIDCKYIVYGREVGESGTPHLQGTIVFEKNKTFKTVCKLIKGHISVTRDVQASINYCKKDGDVFEKGVAPLTQKGKGEKEKIRWKKILEAAEAGDWNWLKENEPKAMIQYDRNLERISKRARTTPQTLEELNNEWYYGPTGTGKSYKAHEDNPGAYIKDPETKWWDDYEGQEVVIMDDFDVYHKEMGGKIKRWADVRATRVEHKGGSMMINPKKIIITSNYHPEDIWQDPETLEPIRRRFKITHFSTPFKKNKNN